MNIIRQFIADSYSIKCKAVPKLLLRFVPGWPKLRYPNTPPTQPSLSCVAFYCFSAQTSQLTIFFVCVPCKLYVLEISC